MQKLKFPYKVRYSLKGMKQLRKKRDNKEGLAVSKTPSGQIAVLWDKAKYKDYLHPSLIEGI